MTAAISVRGLTKTFGELRAVDGLDLTVSRGECVGLLGPNGAGKTTTVEILEGLQGPTSGDVEVLGLRWAKDGDELRARIGLALQETHFYERLTVRETLELFESFYPRALTPDAAIAAVKLEEKADVQVRKLSGGQKQRLALAVALIGDPELLFLDEPTTGLDPQSRRALWDVVFALKGQGRTVVLTTHYMEEATALCDRIVFVDHGRVIAEGTPKELIQRLGGDQLIELSTEPPLPAGAFAGIPGLVTDALTDGVHRLTVKSLHETLPAVISRCGDAKMKGLSTREATLEDVFLQLTGRSLREGGEG